MSQDVRREIVVLQSTARSGTTWLKSTLDTHSLVKSTGEAFHPSFFPNGYYKYLSERVQGDPAALFPGGMRDTQAEYLESLRPESNGVTLVDLKLEHVESIQHLYNAILKTASKAVVLQRTNVLLQSISSEMMLARQKSGDSVVHRDYTPEQISIEVNVKSVLSRMATKFDLHQKYIALLSRSKIPYTIISYEGLSRDFQTQLENLQTFLEIPVESLQSSLAKQTVAPISQIVKNYDELTDAVRQSRFSYTLDM